MPEKKTMQRARRDKQEGKSATTQAGEFVREEMHHIREGKHGAANTKQAIAIGLSKARKSGVDLPPPGPGEASEKTRKSAARAYARGRSGSKRKASPARSRAAKTALERQPRRAASRTALAKQARSSAKRRGPTARSAAARKASHTKGAARRSSAARKAARTRRAHAH